MIKKEKERRTGEEGHIKEKGIEKDDTKWRKWKMKTKHERGKHERKGEK